MWHPLVGGAGQGGELQLTVQWAFNPLVAYVASLTNVAEIQPCTRLDAPDPSMRKWSTRHLDESPAWYVLPWTFDSYNSLLRHPIFI